MADLLSGLGLAHPTPPWVKWRTWGGGQGWKGMGVLMVGGGISIVFKGDRQLGRSWAFTIGGRNSGSASSHSDILEPSPRRDQGRSTQRWACCALASGVATRSGGHGTTYSQSCCSGKAQGKCSQHLRGNGGCEQAARRAGGEASTEEGFSGNTATQRDSDVQALSKQCSPCPPATTPAEKDDR